MEIISKEKWKTKNNLKGVAIRQYYCGTLLFFNIKKTLDFLKVLWYCVVLTGGTTHEKYDKRAMARKHRTARG